MSVEKDVQREMIEVFTKGFALRADNLIHAQHEINSNPDQFEDLLGDDETLRLLEGLDRTTKMQPGRTYIAKGGNFVQSNGRRKRTGVVYDLGTEPKYDALVAAPEEERTAAVEVMRIACRKLGFMFKGFIMQAVNVPYFPGIVYVTYVGFRQDVNRYMFAADLSLFHPLFIVVH